MKIKKYANKDDWDGSDIILKRKICIYSARGPSLANVIKNIVSNICTYFTFYHWQGAGQNSKFA